MRGSGRFGEWELTQIALQTVHLIGISTIHVKFLDVQQPEVEQYLLIWLFLGGLTIVAPFTEGSGLSAIEPASLLVVASVAVSLVASHVFSYWYEYLGNREFERRGPFSLLIEPGTRFLALFGAVFTGGAAIQITRGPFAVVIVLIFFKTCADLSQHRRDRKQAMQGHET
jgi:hypothetical protein